jgi:hypothetical protein
MRLDENSKRKRKLKIRSKKALTIPLDGRVTWSKNSFKKKPIVWGFPAKHKVTGQGRIDANTRIFLNNMELMKAERKNKFSD